MYAIIETGGKQYRVQKGDLLDVELLSNLAKGDSVELSNVLFLFDGKSGRVGAPQVAGCKVMAEYLEEVKAPKVTAFKYKQRKNYRRKVGHRQRYARVRIAEIVG